MNKKEILEIKKQFKPEIVRSPVSAVAMWTGRKTKKPN